MKLLCLKTISVSVLSLFVSGFCVNLHAKNIDNNNGSYNINYIKTLKKNINSKIKTPAEIITSDSNKNNLIKDWNIYGNLVYKVLSDEFISQRKPMDIFESYIYLSNYLKDPRLAERATQIAIDSNNFQKAKQAALLWKEYVKDEDKFNLYRTLSYLSVQLKDYSKLNEYVSLWLDSIPDSKINIKESDKAKIDKINNSDKKSQKINKKDNKFISEITNLPNIINITDPVIVNDIADKILSYKTLEARLATAKLLIRAKQNKGLEIINSLRNEFPNQEDIFFTWLSAVSIKQQIDELKIYIQKAKMAQESKEILNAKQSNQIKDSKVNNVNDTSLAEEEPEYNLKRAQFTLLGTLFASGDFKGGIEFGNKLVIDSPEDLEYSFLLAQFYRVQKDYKTSYKVMTNLLEHHKRLPLAMYIFLADISKEMKDYKLAAYWLEQTSVNDIAVIKDIASLYLQANEYEKAYKYYKQMRNSLFDADKLQKFDMLSLKLWLAAKQWDYALEIINRLILENPNSADLYSIRSDIYLFINDLEKAELDLNVIVNLDTNNINALNSLAYIYAQKSIKLDLAIEYIKKAIDKDSENYAYQDTMGWVLYKQGKVEQARKWLEQSWNTQPDAETGNHLGQVLWQLGERDQAKIIWELSKKIESSSEETQKELQNNLNRK